MQPTGRGDVKARMAASEAAKQARIPRPDCDTAEGQSWDEPVNRVGEYEVDCSVSWREWSGRGKDGE